MRRLMLAIGLLLAVSLVLVSCAQATKESPPTFGRGESVVGSVPSPIAPQAGGGFDTSSVDTVTGERMIVRTGDISLVVKDVAVARDGVAQLAATLEGYVVSSWIAGEGEEMRGNISIRVPDEKFDQALVEIRGLAVRVERESTSSQDVTEQYTDLEARLKNAEATEQQYLALLDRATDVEDMLKIQDSLSRVRAEIEQIKGRMQYLERTSSMSLITVSLQPAVSAKPLAPVGWSALETLKSAVRGLIILGKWLANIGIWLLIFLPIWGTILGIIYWRLRRKTKAQ